MRVLGKSIQALILVAFAAVHRVDGCDVAVADWSASGPSTGTRSRCQAGHDACADLDTNGAVGFGDVVTLLSQWGATD